MQRAPDSFYDELEKIAASGRVVGKALRLMDRPKQALRVERAGRELSDKLYKGLMWEPPQPKFMKGKHLPGYRTAAKIVSDNPETLPTVMAPPGTGAWTIGLPSYVLAKTRLEKYLDDALRRKRRAKYRRYAMRGAAAAVPVASFGAGYHVGSRQRRRK